MHPFRLVLSALLLWTATAGARTVTDTLFTSAGDRVIFTYELSRSQSAVTVVFKNPRKTLSDKTLKQYRDREKLAVVFFDRTSQSDDIVFSGMVPEAFMVPSNVNYTPSKDGYFIFFEQDIPTLTFPLRGGGDFQLDIPAYLAYYKKRGNYQLIGYLGKLSLQAEDPVARTEPAAQEPAPVQTVTTSVVEVEADNGNTLQVLDCIGNILRRLPPQTSLPVSESLQADVEQLRNWKYSITDRQLKQKVDETLDAYEDKLKELQKAQAAEQQAQVEKQQEEARQAAMEQQKKEEELQEKQLEETEKGQKRTIWMVIGGALLAVASFVGNQVMQSVRSKRSQKSMMEMQQSLTRKAEADAKRKVENAIKSQTRKMTNLAEEKAKTALKGFTQGLKKKTKDFKI